MVAGLSFISGSYNFEMTPANVQGSQSGDMCDNTGKQPLTLDNEDKYNALIAFLTAQGEREISHFCNCVCVQCSIVAGYRSKPFI